MESRTRSLYVIGVPGSPLVKIGISDCPSSRVNNLRRPTEGTLVPDSVDRAALAILHQEPGGRRLELALHRHFAQRRVVGEWFDLGMVAVPLVKNVVREMKCSWPQGGLAPTTPVAVSAVIEKPATVYIKRCTADIACARPPWLDSDMCRAHDLDAWLRR